MKRYRLAHKLDGYSAELRLEGRRNAAATKAKRAEREGSAEGPREIEEAEAMRALHVIGSTAYPKPPTSRSSANAESSTSATMPFICERALK
jgi:hypothetical protein